MSKNIENLSLLLIYLLPISLITGPAIPDLSITLINLLFLYYLIKHNKFAIIKKEWVLSILFFWICLQTSSIFAENHYLAFADSTIFIRILLIPVFMYFWLLNEDRKIINLLGCIFFVNLFVIFDCIYQFLNYSPELGFGEDILGISSNFYGRLSGPFNDLIPGSFISKFSFLGLCFIFIVLKKKKNLLILSSIIYLILCGIITFISGERMALATFIMGITIGIIIYQNYRLIFLISLTFIAISLIFIHKTHPIYNDYTVIKSTPFHLGQTIQKKYNCGDEECIKIINIQPELKQVLKNFKKSPYGDVYILSIRMFSDNKLFGIGLNNFNYLCNEKNIYQPKDKCWSHPHNFYIQWLTESGILGFTAFIIFLSTILYVIYIKRNQDYAKITFITFSILFWPLMSTGSLLKNWHGIETFFILGVAISLLKINKKKYSKKMSLS